MQEIPIETLKILIQAVSLCCIELRLSCSSGNANRESQKIYTSERVYVSSNYVYPVVQKLPTVNLQNLDTS